MVEKKKKSKYVFKPEMCERMIELGKLGSSQKMIWAELGISAAAAQTFKKNHPEFADALDMALVHSQAYWERELLANLGNKAFNSRLAEIALRGQFGDTYREDRTAKVDLKAEVTVDFSSAVNELIANLKKAG